MLRNGLALALVALLTAGTAPSAWAWGSGHDTVGRCVLKKLPPEWQAKFKPEWMNEYLRDTHYPDEGDLNRIRPEELDWLCKYSDLSVKRMLEPLHNGVPVYGVIERLVHAIRTGDDRLAFFYLALLSHAIADGAACNHDPIIHQLTYTWVPEGTPEGRGLAVLPKTDRDIPFDFAFTESDADTKAVLARRLDALTVPEPPADITLERVFELIDRWHELSMEVNNANTGRIIDAGTRWLSRGDVAAKLDVTGRAGGSRRRQDAHLGDSGRGLGIQGGEHYVCECGWRRLSFDLPWTLSWWCRSRREALLEFHELCVPGQHCDGWRRVEWR